MAGAVLVLCESFSCIALVPPARKRGKSALCAVHARTPTPDEMRWLDWANDTPKFTTPQERAATMQARQERGGWTER